jgi:NADH-quinone oxidoreductase subunit L
MYNLAWAVVLVPLGACALCYLPEAPRRAAHVCIAGTAVSLVLSLLVLGYRLPHSGSAPYQSVITFLTFSPNQDLGGGVVGDVHPQLGIRVDGLSAVLMPVVALISLLVQVSSLASMRGDPALRRYVAILALGTFAMLGFVASPNYFDLFVLWELVGVCSWLLIGHWWQRPAVLGAVRRAFLLTRVGDLALLLAVIFGFVKFAANVALLPPTPGQDVNDPFSFTILGQEWHRAHLGAVAGVGVRSLVVLAVLLLVAAVVASAQLPFQVWLADVTEGPAPAAALVQSAGVAIMGVLLVARSYPLLLEVPQVLAALAVVGAATAVAGAVVALNHADIQRIVAYLTGSHLGLAFVALGVGTLSGAVLHLLTRAWTVALLVLAAGTVVRAYGTRDIREMGGVWSRMPWTSLAMLAGCASSAGLLLLSGFWSLDAVVAAVLRNQLPDGGRVPAALQALLLLAVAAALVLGALAVLRLFAVAFLGEPRRRRGFQPEKVREPGRSVRVPLAVLAVLAGIVGLAGIEGLPATLGNVVFAGALPQREPFSVGAFLLTALLTGGGAVAAWLVWVRRDPAALRLAGPLAGAGAVLTSGAAGLASRGESAAGELLVRAARVAPWLDRRVVDPLTDAVAESVEVAGEVSRGLQPRRLSGYALTAVTGITLLALGVTLAATGHLPGVGASP